MIAHHRETASPRAKISRSGGARSTVLTQPGVFGPWLGAVCTATFSSRQSPFDTAAKRGLLRMKFKGFQGFPINFMLSSWS
ncbi:MAG: hypothetical protein U5L06_03115 [Rhodovibrio sp.]|nr:hypothetical protein [Rhodovibrio sp.]